MPQEQVLLLEEADHIRRDHDPHERQKGFTSRDVFIACVSLNELTTEGSHS